jgi:hypothetical protein
MDETVIYGSLREEGSLEGIQKLSEYLEAKPCIKLCSIISIFVDVIALADFFLEHNIKRTEINPWTILVTTDKSVFFNQPSGRASTFVPPFAILGPYDAYYERRNANIVWSICSSLYYSLTKEEPWGGNLEAINKAFKNKEKYKVKDIGDLEFPFSEAAHDKYAVLLTVLRKGLLYDYKSRISLHALLARLKLEHDWELRRMIKGSAVLCFDIPF